MDGLSLTIGGSLGGAIVAGIVKIWTSVNQKTKIEPNPNPFPIQRVNECISVQECNRKMCEMEARICKLEKNVANAVVTTNVSHTARTNVVPMTRNVAVEVDMTVTVAVVMTAMVVTIAEVGQETVAVCLAMMMMNNNGYRL